MSAGIDIRPVRAGDGPACAALWVEFGRALSERMPDTFRPAPAVDGLAEWFEALFASDGPERLRALAFADGAAAGLVHAVIRPSPDPAGTLMRPEHLGDRVVIEDLVVAQHVRSRGIGEQIVSYVEAWGRDNGATTIMLSSDSGGPARRFYERIGFRIVAAQYSRPIEPPP